VAKAGRKAASIKFGIDAEIEKALSTYCKDDQHLSKIYWPRSFRFLSSTVIDALLKKPDLWEELRTPNFEINPEQLQQLIDELKFPTSQHIRVNQRRWITHLLREVSLSRKKFGLGVRLPISDDEAIWPRDLEDKDDLMTSLTDVSLRNDVKRFIWNILDEVIPPEKYCSMLYVGAMRSARKSLPIVIELPDEYVESIQDRIATISDRLSAANHESLLPVDLVEVRGVPTRGTVEPNEEGFSTSGSPWKEGSLGGGLKYGERFVGITSGHK
jgi:hypothetical protein